MFASPGEYVKLNIYGKVVSYSADEKSDCLTLALHSEIGDPFEDRNGNQTRIYLSSRDLELLNAKRVKPVSTYIDGLFSNSWIDIDEEDT